ncbi:MAG: hypothetical protein ACEPOV_01460 [Hyphomicrobiales bacterium]
MNLNFRTNHLSGFFVCIVFLSLFYTSSYAQRGESTFYIEDEAAQVATLSAISYSGILDYNKIVPSIEVNLEDESLATNDKWGLIWHSINRQDSIVMYLAQHKEILHTYALIIRGTDTRSKTNLSDDFDVCDMVDFPLANNKDIKISKGSFNLLESLIRMKGNVINTPYSNVTILEFIQKFTQDHQFQKPINMYIAGHSSGGVAALALGAYLAKETAKIRFIPDFLVKYRVFAFGNPSFGNEAFSAYCNDLSQHPFVGFQFYKYSLSNDYIAKYWIGEPAKMFPESLKWTRTGIRTVKSFQKKIKSCFDKNNIQYVMVPKKNSKRLIVLEDNVIDSSIPKQKKVINSWQDLFDYLSYFHNINNYIKALKGKEVDYLKIAK